MSVPLDRLYNFLYDQSGVDLLIYRWHPHGSRKLADCTQFVDHRGDIFGYSDKPQIICHDQEPLNFALYSHWPDCYHPVMARNLCDETGMPLNPEIKNFFEDINVRSAVNLFNIHDRVLLLHSEKNSNQVALFEDIGCIPVYYFSHALISLDWFRYAQHDKLLQCWAPSNQRPFLIYNRAWQNTREYRLFFTQCLVNSELHKSCNIKFSPIDQGVHYTDYAFQNKNLSIDRYDLENHIAANDHQATASADYCNEDYADCMVEIVLETLFDDTRWHLTEKTLRPIACGRPFVLAAPMKSLQYLREYGFKTFDPVIDEHYDTISEPHLRIQAIVQEMHRISKFTSAQRADFLKHSAAVAAYNKQWFFSQGFFDRVVDEYRHNIQSGLEVMSMHRTGRTRKQIWDLKLKYQTQEIDTVKKFYSIINGS